MAKVSIIINNYNYERYLREAVDSALAQDYPDCEVIVVDDGSTDTSPEIIRGYGDRIIPVLQANAGQGSAMNAGFAACSGDWVIFLDADDKLRPQAMRRALEATAPGVAKVHFRLACIDEAGQTTGVMRPFAKVELSEGDLSERLIRGLSYAGPPTSGNLYARDLLAAILPMEESLYRICADRHLNTLAPFHGRVVAVEELLGEYRVHGGSNWNTARSQLDSACKLLERKRAKHRLIVEAAAAKGIGEGKVYRLDQKFLELRLASLRATPQSHPFPEDTVAWIVCLGVKRGLKRLASKPLAGLHDLFWFPLCGCLPLALVGSWLAARALPDS